MTDKSEKTKIPEIGLEIRTSDECTYTDQVLLPWHGHSAFITAWSMERMSREALLGMLLLDEESKPIGVHTIARGQYKGISDVFSAFALAAKSGAKALWLATNEPDKAPYLQRKHYELKEAFDYYGKKMKIDVVDHLVINREMFSSILATEVARKAGLFDGPNGFDN